LGQPAWRLCVRPGAGRRIRDRRLWNAEPSQRKPLALRWAVFGLAALAACCFTPYGWESILASRKILDLGELLRLLSEWMPADFSKLSPFELTILALIAAMLYLGVKLSPPRIALVVGLLHMALSHGRNVEVFALLLPIVVLTPVSQQFALQPTRSGRITLVSVAMLAVTLGISTGRWRRIRCIRPEKPGAGRRGRGIKAHNLRRVLNDRAFGGYLIWRQMPVFIDGRAELYGEKFTMATTTQCSSRTSVISRSAQGIRHRRIAAAAGHACDGSARSTRAWRGSTPTMWQSSTCAAAVER
jgi:hypothetical protein